ncbi:MAG: glucoamylase family protein [bacterium]
MSRGLLAILALLALVSNARGGTSGEDDAFLDDLEQRSFCFFWRAANPANGLIPDIAPADGTPSTAAASIASVGFGLPAICIAAERGWISREQAYNRILTTLRYFWSGLPNVHGFFYHYVDMESGDRVSNCEVSSIDTALLLAGMLTARQYFPDTEVADLALKIYARADWNWMLAGRKTVCMGWTPERGYLPSHWDSYGELMIIYILAMGSPTHPAPPETWHAWRRAPVMTYDGKTFIQCPTLFIHQYPEAWIDFRNCRDAYADFWRNSELATRAQRQYCMDIRDRFPGYGPNVWGITASDSPRGYMPWGGPPDTPSYAIDGSVVPCAPGGSIPFAPDICIPALRYMKAFYGDLVWGTYGFHDAFNPITQWVSPNVIGIDAGITLLMAENYRSGFVWKYFMKNPEILDAMNRAGFRSTLPELNAKDRKYVSRLCAKTWRAIARATRSLDDYSLSDLGVYLTDLVAAREMKLLDERRAEARMVRALDNLENRPFDQAPAVSNAWRLAAGLITAGQAFPAFEERCGRLLSEMNWRFLYDAAGNRLHAEAGADTSTNDVVGQLASADRMAVFLGIGSEQVPTTAWNALGREVAVKEHAQYLWTPDEDALTQQYLPSLWLKEDDTIMGQSAENLALALMTEADREKKPWSSACVLAIADFPSEVVTNLRRLERSGAQSDEWPDGAGVDAHSKPSSPSLQAQSVVFLSLASYLTDRAVQKYFMSSRIATRARREIADYFRPAFGSNVAYLAFQIPFFGSGSTPARTMIVRREETGIDEAEWQVLSVTNALESGSPADDCASGRFAFLWNEAALIFVMDVNDPTLANARPPDKLWEQDCVELFIDPQSNGLGWANPADAQFGFAVTNKTWEWFGGRSVSNAIVETTPSGYRITADIPWSSLGLSPGPGTTLGASPALHDVNATANAVKLNWSWRPSGDTVTLGQLLLQ